MYHDQSPPRRWQWILAGAFAALLLPNVWLPELVSREAINALIARDIREFGGFMVTTAMGQPTVHPPLASWLLTLISYVLPINEFSVRLVDILSLAGLSVLCAGMAYRALGIHAAAVAAAACFSCLVSVEKGTLGDGTVLFSLAINGAWFVWYHLSRDHRRWLFAWFFAHLLMGVAILAGGPKAIFYFYFPLLFLKRPLSPFRRMRQMDHLLSVFFFAVVMLVWVAMIPDLGRQLLSSFETFQPEQEPATYLWRLATFPVRAGFGYMPWLLLAWPAFCLAFQPLEKVPIFAQFLRTLVWPMTLFFWFLPEGRPGALLPLVAPLSILTGMHYEILIRRHGGNYVTLARLAGWLTVAVAAVGTVWGMVLLASDDRSSLPAWVLYPSMGFLLAALAVSIWLLRPGVRGPVWLVLTMAMVGVGLSYASIVRVHAYRDRSPRREVAARLMAAIPEEVTIYLQVPTPQSLVAESFYLHRPVRRITLVSELPKQERTVYLLGRDQAPVTGDRDWSPVSSRISYDTMELRVWKGESR